VIDFLPYKIGNNILEEMKTPPDAKPDEYELTYTLQNKKTSATKTMTDKEYLKTGIWKDATWVIVGNPESRLVKKGFMPKITDLAIHDAQGNDYTQELLSSPYYQLYIVAYNLKATNSKAINRINALAVNLTQNYNVRTIFLTANSPTDAVAFAKDRRLISEIFYADGVPLKSMVRANPGIILVKNGTVVNKWHYNNMPKYDTLVQEYLAK
jgi:hypothetical protein